MKSFVPSKANNYGFDDKLLFGSENLVLRGAPPAIECFRRIGNQWQLIPRELIRRVSIESDDRYTRHRLHALYTAGAILFLIVGVTCLLSRFLPNGPSVAVAPCILACAVGVGLLFVDKMTLYRRKVHFVYVSFADKDEIFFGIRSVFEDTDRERAVAVATFLHQTVLGVRPTGISEVNWHRYYTDGSAIADLTHN